MNCQFLDPILTLWGNNPDLMGEIILTLWGMKPDLMGAAARHPLCG